MNSTRFVFFATLGILAGARGARAEDAGQPTLEAIEQKIQRALEELGSEEFAVREEASETLESMGRALLATLRAGTASEDPEVRRRARDVLSHLHAESKGAREVIFEFLLSRNAYSEEFRREGADLLKETGREGEEALLDILLEENENPSAIFSIRQRAVRLLESRSGKPFGEDRFREALRSEDSTLRFFAIEGLVALDYRECLPDVIALLPAAHASVNEFAAVMRASAAWGDKATLDTLRSAVDPASLPEVAMAIEFGAALLTLGDPEGGDVVIGCLDAQTPADRTRAHNCIAEFFSYEVVGDYEVFDTGEPEARKAAIERIRTWWTGQRDSWKGTRRNE